MDDQSPLLEMQAITKRFPGVIANDAISLDVRPGEIHALLGENGAGKSTLMKILYGLYSPDEGSIVFQGKPVHIDSPKVAVDVGIGMVHQHFMLVENMSALENVMLGLPQAKPPMLDLDGTRKKFLELVDKYGLVVDPDMPVWQMSVGKQQWLEILRLLFRDVKLLILDEPTAVLTPTEADQLFATLNYLVKEGRSIIFITHKLEEVRKVADRITVLRDGKVVGTVQKKNTTITELSTMMVGRPISLARKPRNLEINHKPALVIENLFCNNDRGLPAIKQISLTINTGEILGVAGVDGNGQLELAECIAGLRKPVSGRILINGDEIHETLNKPKVLGFIPEDRHKTGLIIDFSIMENMVLRTYNQQPFANKGIINWDHVKKSAEELVSQYDVRTPNVNVPVSMLSGGNQQKVILARETYSQPAVIIGSQPTRGLDLGAIDALHELLLEERNRGAAVLFISTELSEVMSLSDRIIVLYNGEIMGELPGESADVLTIGEMMMGHSRSSLAGKQNDEGEWQ